MVRLFLLVLCLLSGVLHAQWRVAEGTARLLPPGVPNTSVYFTIENRSESTKFLVGASTDIADKVEIHNHILINDMMRMQQQSEVEIGPGQTVHFKPGGLHVMLFGLKRPLKENTYLPLTLQTKSGETINFNAKVVKPSAHVHH